MRYNAQSSGRFQENIQKDNLEETLLSMKKDILVEMASRIGFNITARLPLTFEAKVLRKLKPGREIVRLTSGSMCVDVFRDTAGEPGELGVSCNPDGDEVPVVTLNIKFRDIEDVFTDRGIVWVQPGNPAKMNLFITNEALMTPGMVEEIITAAEEAIKNKVLVHFPHIVTL